jgi:hypothetical protein
MIFVDFIAPLFAVVAPHHMQLSCSDQLGEGTPNRFLVHPRPFDQFRQTDASHEATFGIQIVASEQYVRQIFRPNRANGLLRRSEPRDPRNEEVMVPLLPSGESLFAEV